jgi:hypothetical protein
MLNKAMIGLDDVGCALTGTLGCPSSPSNEDEWELTTPVDNRIPGKP